MKRNTHFNRRMTVNNCDNPDNLYTFEYSTCDLSSESQSEFFCKSINKKPLVHAEDCKSNSDCASGICGNGTFFQTCIGKVFNSSCASTRECETGLYCDTTEKKCINQKQESSICISDEECENLSGCLNGLCTKYWSLPGFSAIANNDLAEVYCQSGFSYKGQCMSPVNLDHLPYNCETSCRYTLLENNQNITINEMCSCGYNNEGLKYCQHGVQSIVFNKYIELSKTILTKGCHVSKKFDCASDIDKADILQRRNYYLAWKGKFQLSNECLILFFASTNFISVSKLVVYVVPLTYLWL